MRNLREILPTVYYNVPRGFEMLLPLLQADLDLRRSLFRRLQAFTYAGAALAPHVREGFERVGLDMIGEAVSMPTSFGSTETGPSAISVTDRARDPGVIGVPNPGVELKLVPNAGKLEARVESSSVTPGYWRQPELSEGAFDEEGFYKFGDALRFVDENDPERGFLFDGRVAEDFKLATGAWVSVGPLRADPLPIARLMSPTWSWPDTIATKLPRSSFPISPPAGSSPAPRTAHRARRDFRLRQRAQAVRRPPRDASTPRRAAAPAAWPG